MHAWEAIDESLAYIEVHLSEDIETKVLADRVFLSTFYFQRLFKRLVKKSVHEYIKLRRLAKAVEKLDQTEERIIDIAFELGFSDHSNFTRTFKEAYHLTPEDYRKTKPLMNVIKKPNISANYSLMEENVPLIIGNMILEISQKEAEAEVYLGVEGEIIKDQQVPVGEQTGIDRPGELWQTFHSKKHQLGQPIQVEMGMSFDFQPNQETFTYFTGGLLENPDLEVEGMVKKTVPSGNYLVCKIEAETREELVTVGLDQAYHYLFGVWLPKHNQTTAAFSVEKYLAYDGICCMELWLKLL